MSDVRDYDVSGIAPALIVLEALEAGLQGLQPLPDIDEMILSTRNDGTEAFIVAFADGRHFRFQVEEIADPDDPDLCQGCGASYKDAHAEDCPIWLDMQADGV